MFCFVFVLFGRFDSCFSRFFETLEPEKLKSTLVKTHEGSAMNQKRKSRCLEAKRSQETEARRTNRRQARSVGSRHRCTESQQIASFN